MAKRKLLNSEREIILSKTLQHVFKDVLFKLDAERIDKFMNALEESIKNECTGNSKSN